MKLKNQLTCSQIAEFIEGRLTGNPDSLIFGLNGIAEAGQGELTFYSDVKYKKFLETTKATCILIPDGIDVTPVNGQTIIFVPNPYKAFVKIVSFIDSLKADKSSFIHPSAVIGYDTAISPSAYIGPNCTIGNNVTIGDNTVLMSNIAVYDDVSIGNNCRLHANVVVCCDTVIGDNCLLLPGAVIGSDGFGFVENKDGSYTKIPQIGNVIIGNNVEIGANTTIDRAMIGSTIISDGVKLDNLIQIGHNCKIGENTGMAAQVGISGSTNVGRRNRFGGQVGLAGHLDTADDVVIYAQSGVPKSIKNPGVYMGSPIKPRLHYFKIEAVLNNLPDFYKNFYEFKNKK